MNKPVAWLCMSLFFAACTILSAAPSISGVSGTASNGGTLTISGTGFGTGKAPLLWDDFELGVNGAALPAAPRRGDWTLQSGGGVFTNATSHAGTFSSTSLYPNGGGFKNILYEPLSHSTGAKYYQSYWFRHTSPVGGAGQAKLTQVWGSYRVGDYNPGVMTGGFSGDWWSSYIALENSGGYRQTDYPSIPARNQWHLFEMLLLQSDANAANGRVTIRINGRNVYDQNPVKTRERADEGWDFTTFFDGMTNWTGQTQTWVDDVYFSDSWARVMIGDSADLGKCIKRDLQVHSLWENNRIVVSVNTGAFQSGARVYLFVVDENDQTSPGYAVTIGGPASVALRPSTTPAGMIAGPATFKFYNLEGRLVMSFLGHSRDFTVQLASLEKRLSAGPYLCRVYNKTANFTIKRVVLR